MKKSNLLISLIALMLLFGCEKEGQEGKNSLIRLDSEMPGDNCQTGGYKILTGIDVNNNDILDDVEIQDEEYICNGINGIYDKEIKFPLWSGAFSYTETMNINKTKLLGFDIRNYPEIDSISFVVYDIATYDGSGSPINYASTIELYDMTNNISIEGSMIISDDITLGSYVATNNLINTFPKQTIDIGIKVTDAININTLSGDCYLVLTRK